MTSMHRGSISSNPPFTNVSRYLAALIRGDGSLANATMIASSWLDAPEVTMTLKAVTSAVDIADAGAGLAGYGISAEFQKLIAGTSVLGKLRPLFRTIPLMTNVPVETASPVGAWIGESGAIPVGKFNFDTVQIAPFKCGVICVISKELAKVSTPTAESELRMETARAVAAFLDQQFLDQRVAAVSLKSPASITNGAGVVTSGGSATAQIAADLQALVALLGNFGAARWVMRPQTAVVLAGKNNVSGQKEFPTVGAEGGSLLGIPVLTSTNSPQQISLIDCADILYGEGVNSLSIDMSTETSLEMDSEPITGELSPFSQMSQWKSLYQNSLSAIRVLQTISWARGRSTSVASMRVAY